MLRAVIKSNIKTWEDCLPHVEFAYNRAVHSTTKHSPFELVYGFNPLTPLDLTPLPLKEQVNMDGAKKAEFVKNLHEKARLNIEMRMEQIMKNVNRNRKPRSFEVGDWVWVHLRKERFPHQRRSKLLPRSEGPFQVISKVGNNAYKIDLPREYGISATFNVSDLAPYLEDNSDLRSNLFQGGGTDEVIKTKSISSQEGPITRLQAKRLREEFAVYLDRHFAQMDVDHHHGKTITLLQLVDQHEGKMGLEGEDDSTKEEEGSLKCEKDQGGKGIKGGNTREC
ncbi:unnamed protein product [Linum trigynum]|uniref:Tf2-1-like SH3-like domain-containing protein n=1 Tax=Linum trigynum TaxID=586398 RepID=A0AAV2CU95_9ROSI